MAPSSYPIVRQSLMTHSSSLIVAQPLKPSITAIEKIPANLIFMVRSVGKDPAIRLEFRKHVSSAVAVAAVIMVTYHRKVFKNQ
jgi:hypothetical protein